MSSTDLVQSKKFLRQAAYKSAQKQAAEGKTKEEKVIHYKLMKQFKTLQAHKIKKEQLRLSELRHVKINPNPNVLYNSLIKLHNEVEHSNTKKHKVNRSQCLSDMAFLCDVPSDTVDFERTVLVAVDDQISAIEHDQKMKELSKLVSVVTSKVPEYSNYRKKVSLELTSHGLKSMATLSGTFDHDEIEQLLTNPKSGKQRSTNSKTFKSTKRLVLQKSRQVLSEYRLQKHIRTDDTTRSEEYMMPVSSIEELDDNLDEDLVEPVRQVEPTEPVDN